MKTYTLNIGPQHPSTHGVLRFVAEINGEEIQNLKCDIGFLHRSIEKILENKEYYQGIPYTDRVDYLAPINSNFPLVLAIEKLANIEVPEKAEYIRVITSELNRIASHLLWFGAFNLDLGSFTPFMYGMREREKILSIFEKLTGARMLYNYLRIGGVAKDLYEKFEDDVLRFLTDLDNKLVQYNKLVTKNIIFKARTQGVGKLSKDLALKYGVTGPSLRASGVNYDIRKKIPYSIYSKLEFDVPTYQKGDAYSRFRVRINEINESMKIIRQCLIQIPKKGDFINKPPVVFKVSPGETYIPTEAPRGELGIYLVSDGTEKPYRVKIRSAGFNTLNCLEELAIGQKIADLIATFGSLDIILPEVDR